MKVYFCLIYYLFKLIILKKTEGTIEEDNVSKADNLPKSRTSKRGTITQLPKRVQTHLLLLTLTQARLQVRLLRTQHCG